MELGYLISPIVQIVDNNGKPVVGAKIYVYNANTTVLVDTYNDFEGHLNTNPVLADTLGNCTIITDTSKAYDIIVNDENDTLLFSKKNITIASGVDPSSALAFEGGDGIIVERTGNTVTISVDTTVIATQDDLATKQDKMYAGNNIVINDNTVSLASAVRLSNVLYQTDYKRNGIETKSNLTEDYTVVKSDGVRIANESDDDYFVIDQHAIEGGDGNDLVRLDATSLDIDHNDSSQQRQIHLGTAGGPDSDWVQGLLIKNSVNAGSLTADTYDVLLQNNSGTYSLTATNQLANSAMSVAQNPGQGLTAGANIKITGNTVSGRDWTNEIAQATSGKLDTSATTNWDVAAYSAGNNINITNHVVSGKDWTSTINNAASANNWDVTPYTGGTGISVNNHQISLDTPVYLDAQSFPTYYTFTALDGQTGNASWLNVPNTEYQNGIEKNNNENCYSLVDRTANKMCEVDADFVIKVDALPGDATIIDIGYGVENSKITSAPICRNVLFYATGIYYIHLHCFIYGKDFYFFGSNRSNLVGGGTASVYLQNVTIRSI